MTPPVSKWNVPPGSLSRPIHTFLTLLSAPLRCWQKTVAHTVALEVSRFPRRILATYRTRYPNLPVRIPSDPRQIPLSIGFEVACNEGMERLWKERGSLGPLDLEVYVRGFCDGGKYVVRTSYKEVHSKETASRQE